MFLLRNSASWSSLRSFSLTPATTTSPFVGLSTPPIMWRRVDLPDPEGPRMHWKIPYCDRHVRMRDGKIVD